MPCTYASRYWQSKPTAGERGKVAERPLVSAFLCCQMRNTCCLGGVDSVRAHDTITPLTSPFKPPVSAPLTAESVTSAKEERKKRIVALSW